MTDKSIRVAILDDGINPEACPLAGSFLIDNDSHEIIMERNTAAPDSHGSMCARIIHKYTDLDKASIYSIQILRDNTKRGNKENIL